MFKERGVKELKKSKRTLNTTLTTAVALILTGCAGENFVQKAQGQSNASETPAPITNNAEYIVKITNV